MQTNQQTLIYTAATPERWQNELDYQSGLRNTMDQKRDDTYKYNCCLLSYGLLFVEFLDAIAEGDGDRNLRCWKMLLLHFKNDTGSTKYASLHFKSTAC